MHNNISWSTEHLKYVLLLFSLFVCGNFMFVVLSLGWLSSVFYSIEALFCGFVYTFCFGWSLRRSNCVGFLRVNEMQKPTNSIFMTQMPLWRCNYENSLFLMLCHRCFALITLWTPTQKKIFAKHTQVR